MLDAYEPERQEIARQILTSSDAMHGYYDRLIAMAAEGNPLTDPPDDPTRKVMSGSPIDLVLFESPIIGFYGSGSAKLETRLSVPGTHAPERLPSSSSFVMAGPRKRITPVLPHAGLVR